jgi:hypothetical protein
VVDPVGADVVEAPDEVDVVDELLEDEPPQPAKIPAIATHAATTNHGRTDRGWFTTAYIGRERYQRALLLVPRAASLSR